ncbi:MAG: hypothetical protein U5K72_16015 [Balneolaceae bacterium]|nr:hypothetical protein [Balneolaceae bacterium]
MYFQILEDYSSNVEDVYKSIDRNDYVYKKDGSYVCVVSGTSGNDRGEKLWKLEHIEGDNEHYPYFEIRDNYNRYKPNSLAKISFVLAFRHNCDNSILEDFGYHNDLRE